MVFSFLVPITFRVRYPAVGQCCGGKIISISEKCCGNNEQGTGYTFDKNRICCGASFVNPELSLCCTNEVGQHKVSLRRERHIYVIDVSGMEKHKAALEI